MQVSELITYLDQKFDSLTEIFVTKDEFLDFELRIGNRFEGLEAKISEMYTNLDTYAKNTDTYTQELTMLGSQVRRHERWHQQTADKLNIKLKS